MAASAIKVTIEKNELVIRCAIPKELTHSHSQKNLLLASTGGNLTTGVQYEGKEVVLGLNAYIKA